MTARAHGILGGARERLMRVEQGSKAGLAAAALAIAPTPLAADDQRLAPPDLEPPLIVAVLAHPDDEMPMSAALAALARKGNRVRIVHATPGDAGPGFSGLPKGEALGAVRRAEADCAGKALGVGEVVNLGFHDGALADHMRDGSLSKALHDHVTAADMVLTWGPDGGYGHADHRLVSAIATQIAQGQPAGDRPRVLYVGLPNGTTAGLPPLADWATTDPALLTAGIPYDKEDVAAAAKAAQCHVTQFDAATRDGMAAAFDATIWRGEVHFRPAF
jgi:LmbE family N-acetylglucosaminyl deacetylase